MGENTAISWTRHTFNPWWGCVKVSPGCAHCYAETFAKRTGNDVWGAEAPRRFFGAKHWGEPLKWDLAAARLGERHRVFCASMADWLEDRDDLVEPLAQLLDLIRVTPNLDWLLLTKRPEHFRARLEKVLEIIPRTGLELNHAMLRSRIEIMMTGWAGYSYIAPGIGIENYWIGTTVEDQQRADVRIPHLLSIPAKVRFLSCEPLLGPVNLTLKHSVMAGGYNSLKPYRPDGCTEPEQPRIHWVIVGGESGPGFRPFNPEWARSLRAECAAAGVAFHMKQMGGLKPSMMPPIPQDLMIREYPKP